MCLRLNLLLSVSFSKRLAFRILSATGHVQNLFCATSGSSCQICISGMIEQQTFTLGWTSRSLGLNYFDYLLQVQINHFVHGGLIKELKTRFTSYIVAVSCRTLLWVVEYAVLRFQSLEENGGQHVANFKIIQLSSSFLNVFISFLLLYTFWPREN